MELFILFSCIKNPPLRFMRDGELFCGTFQNEYVIGAASDARVECLANYHIPLNDIERYTYVVMTKIAGSGTISRGQLFFIDAAYSVISGIDISANQTYNFKSLLPENTVFVRIGVVANSNSGFNGVSVKFAFS